MTTLACLTNEPIEQIFSNAAVLLDFDGTLVDLAPDPGTVYVPPETIRLLTQLQENLAGAIALVSGRRISDLDRFLAPLSLMAAGCYGAEMRLQPGGPMRVLGEALPTDFVENIKMLVAGIPGVIVENKIYGLALHFQGVPAIRLWLERELPFLLKAYPHIDLSFDKRGCEIKRHRLNKGDAVKILLAQPPFKGKRPVFIGDDVPDRAAFAAVRGLGGFAVQVGFEPAAEANFHLPSVQAVHRWLAPEKLTGPQS